MALQIQKFLKSGVKISNTRALSSSGIFNNGFDANQNPSNKLHLAVQRDYPQAEPLPLPANIIASETARFSPLRNRDITGSAIIVHQESYGIDITLDEKMEANQPQSVVFDDPHVNSYDRSASVNLCSVMQSTVPEPYGGNHRYSFLNMPGSQWGQQTKYLSHELNAAHYTELRQEVRENWSQYNAKGTMLGSGMLSLANHSFIKQMNAPFLTINKRYISLNAKNFNDHAQKSVPVDEKPGNKETNASKLKKAVKEYGSTVIVFHVGISLMSLGMFYALVSSGLDVMAILEKINLADKLPAIAPNASTFIIAYAVHKIFAPVRISITLGSTPFIVKYLRSKNFLKK